MENDREWDSIIGFYAEFVDRWRCSQGMHALVTRLKDDGFVAAGLKGGTSMHTLFLSQSRAIHHGDSLSIPPRLRIEGSGDWPPKPVLAQITYEDGSERPWSIKVEWDELPDRVVRLLVKRLRWFKTPELLEQ